jgi:hypothetical protein
MSLPPLANVFAIKSADPPLLDRVEGRVRAAKEGWSLRRPSPSWLVAVQSLPPTALTLEENVGIFFTEGGDQFEDTRGSIGTGSDSLARHQGDFGFLHVAPDAAATFVRSCGGRVPAYIRREGAYLALATRLTDLVELTPDAVELDPLPCAIWSIGQPIFPDDRTFFRGISQLPRGHVMTITADDRTRIDRYWDPRPDSLPEPTEAERREHIERCRSLLLDCLSRELNPDGHNLLTLSGGVDSSAMAALAAGTLGYPVSTISLLPTDEPHRRHAMSFIENLRRNYRFEKTWEFPLDQRGRVEAAASAPAVAFPVVNPALGLLPRVLEEKPHQVLFGGEFADQVCGSRFTVPDWLRHTSLTQLARDRARWPEGRRTFPRWVKQRMLGVAGRPHLPLPDELPTYVQPAVRQEYLDWRADRRRKVAADRRPLRYLALAADRDGFVPLSWEAASVLGVRTVWPFFNRAILELAFECHPRELVGPGTKRLLRAALKGDVPPMNLERADRGYWTTSDRSGPPPPSVPEMEHIFDLARLPREEAEIGLPTSWVFRRFLDSLRGLRSPLA